RSWFGLVDFWAPSCFARPLRKKHRVIFALLRVIVGSMQSGHGSTLLSTCFIDLLVYGGMLYIPTTQVKLTGDNTNYGPKVVFFCSRILVFVLKRMDEPSTWNCFIPRARFRIALFQWMLLLLRCSYEEKPINRQDYCTY
ncbi:hypothetical protein LB507_002808, partial [Fusarium sp. FIESC RH6]